MTLTGATCRNREGQLQPSSRAGGRDITAKPITGDFTAENKVYDGNSATVLSPDADWRGDADAVSLIGGTATFDNKNVGTGKNVTLTGASLAGADAGNYTLTRSARRPADITAKR